MSSFCKNEDCPASDELLAFQYGELPIAESTGIRSHLRVCEFCSAEVDFYSHYPPAEESVMPAEMPKSLHDLAEALLAKKQDDSFFDELMHESLDR